MEPDRIQHITINPSNIEAVICNLKNTLEKIYTPDYGFIMPKTYRVLSKRYRGKGRPRKSDYDHEDFLKLLEV